MSVFDIIKITIVSVGIVLIVHLLLKILLNQETKQIKKTKKKVTFSPFEPNVIPSQTISMDTPDQMNLADIKNELKDWIETQKPCDNYTDNDLDKVFRESQVDIKNIIDEVPKPIEKPDYDFSAQNANTRPSIPQLPEEPMAWNLAFEHIEGKNNQADEFGAWDNGNYGFAPL